MATEATFKLDGCRRLFDAYPASTSLRPVVDLIEQTIFNEPGIAYTHCRGLLETVCITILTERSVVVPSLAEPRWLMARAVELLDLTPIREEGNTAENGVRDVLKGLNLLVAGVAELRKSQGVGPHGRDVLERVLSHEYALLTARAVDAAVGLLFGLHQEQLRKDPLKNLRFEANTAFNEYLDAKYVDLQIEEAPILASQALYQQDLSAYRKSLVEFKAQPEAESASITEGETLPEDVV